MKFFTLTEFTTKYPEYESTQIYDWQIEAVCEMIFSQIGLIYREGSWDDTSVPEPIKNACMEQLRFAIEHDLPYVDINETLRAGSMDARLKSDYSTLALRILANNGYLYRGNNINANMGLNIPFGD